MIIFTNIQCIGQLGKVELISNFHKSELTNHINLQPDFIITIIDGGKMLCYLCFDQITKNMEYLTQYLLYPHKWGENVRKRNYQCSQRTLLISLPKGVPWERRLMVIYGDPETLSQCWL